VVLSPADFKKANVEATQTAGIVSFVDASELSPTFFETPYYLVPAKRGEKTYVLLREALRKSGKIGIAYVVIRSRQHLAALYPQDSMLVLNTLRYGYEIRSMDDYEVPKAGGKAAHVQPKELDMALKLVDEMSEAWRPERYEDSYRDDILARVKEKVKAGETEEVTDEDKAPAPKRSAEVIDLMSLLKGSLDRKKGKKGMKAGSRRARGAHATERRRRA
jgi:DNA end-binding protein Ku